MEDADGTHATTKPTTQASGSGLPVLPPRTAVLEILLLVVLPGLLDYFVPGFPSLNDTQPHFFWLAVVLLSAQYGSLSGLLAAGTAIVLASLLGWPEQEIGENHFSYLLRIWLQPVLWIGTAVVLGQFRLRQIEKKEALSRAVEELTSQRHSIAEHARNLRARCGHLERLIAARHEPEARALLTSLGRTQADEASVADRALHDTLRLAFGDCRAAVYVLEAGELRLATRHNHGTPQQGVGSIDAHEPIYVSTVVAGRALCILNPGDEVDLKGRGLAAVPILRFDRTVAGLLVLEAAPPSEIDDGTTARLAAVAALIALRLSDHLRAAAHPRPALQLATPPERLAISERRAWRHVKWRGDANRSTSVRAVKRSG